MSLNAENFESAQPGPGTIQLQTDGDGQEQELIMSSTVTDFARKLYNLLEDPTHTSVICWGLEKDRFTIKDTNEFAKTILPRVFNHSNFSSFVRQLNKYDFHKVRKEHSQDLHQTWTFQHPHFHGDRPGDLQYIRRKAAAATQSDGPRAEPSTSSNNVDSFQFQPSRLSYSSDFDADQSQSSDQATTGLLLKIDRLRDDSEDLRTRTRTLERNYESMDSKLKDVEAAVALRQAQMDSLMQQFGDIPDGSSRSSNDKYHHNTPSPCPLHTSGVPDSPNFSIYQPQMLQSPSNLPPLFTRVPLNLAGDHPRSQQGKDSLSPGYVMSITAEPSSLNYSADPPINTTSANSINTHRDLRPNYEGGRLSSTPAQGHYGEHTREQTRSTGAPEHFDEKSYSFSPEEESEEFPTRVTKRLRTSDEVPHGWPSGTPSTTFQNPTI